MKIRIIGRMVENTQDLHAVVEEVGDSLAEIVITGTPRTPLAGVVRPLGMQLVMTTGRSTAWGVRTALQYYCFGRDVAAVLRVAHSLEND